MRPEWKEARSYKSLQFHFHSPSEHSVEGELQDAEMHIVHQDPESKEIAVVGVMFDVMESENDEDNWFVRQMMELYDNENGVTEVNMGKFLAGISHMDFWSYDGSFTTPPCTEGVKWTVLSQVQPISMRQLANFQEMYLGSKHATVGNNRVVMPLNDRKLHQSMSHGDMKKDHDDMDMDMWNDMMDMMMGGASTTLASVAAVAAAITVAAF